MEASSQEVTLLLESWRNGDADALDKLIPLVYDELHRIARQQKGCLSNQTLQTKDVIHEAYLRLARLEQAPWQDRQHFFSVCARMMRCLLIDRTRRRRRHPIVLLEDVEFILPEPDVNLEALDEALNRLESLQPRQSRVVELRYFVGLSLEEIAPVLSVSLETVKRDWTQAKRWLKSQLDMEESE